ncbi:MAG: hypothetical protein CM1200mP9_00210 [Gammaproteobacteria bacterium]|nr:MAG: hypothetical protein CM1200mP9_00210 [Gammaproteobacteria bacterium]
MHCSLTDDNTKSWHSHIIGRASNRKAGASDVHWLPEKRDRIGAFLLVVASVRNQTQVLGC